jgi:predicted nucleic acid-binding protein
VARRPRPRRLFTLPLRGSFRYRPRANNLHALEADDYEEAALMNNRCCARGIAGSAIDFLICAAAHRRNWTILTTDRDFENYASVLYVRLHSGSTSR